MAERKIGDKIYRVTPMAASDALELYGEIIRVVGQGAGRLPAIILGLASDGDERTIMGDVAFLAALSDIMNSAGPQAVRDLIRRIVESAMVHAPSGEYRPVSLDGDFSGNLSALIPVAKFVITETYGDFFPASGGSGLLAKVRDILQRTK